MGDGDIDYHEEYTPKIILARLNEFRKEGKFCDVKIVVGDAEFLAHKVILAAFSSYLEGMFSRGNSGTRHFILELNCVEASLMDVVLEYAYTTEISLSERNVNGLLHLANFFKAAPLFESCCLYMENNINVKNCVSYYKVAISYSCESLRKKTVDYIRQNIAAVCLEREFLELPSVNVREILAWRTVDYRCKEVSHAVLRWYHFKRPERFDDISTIVQIFPKLDISALDQDRTDHPAEDNLIHQG